MFERGNNYLLQRTADEKEDFYIPPLTYLLPSQKSLVQSKYLLDTIA
jgi:hypothetical protein